MRTDNSYSINFNARVVIRCVEPLIFLQTCGTFLIDWSGIPQPSSPRDACMLCHCCGLTGSVASVRQLAAWTDNFLPTANASFLVRATHRE